MNKIVFYVVAFDPNKIQASWAPQNVPVNPSFVKDINVVGRTMARNGRKMTTIPRFSAVFPQRITIF